MNLRDIYAMIAALKNDPAYLFSPSGLLNNASDFAQAKADIAGQAIAEGLARNGTLSPVPSALVGTSVQMLPTALMIAAAPTEASVAADLDAPVVRLKPTSANTGARMPWQMSPEEFATAEAKGMGPGGTWSNAVKADDGRIYVTNREHGDLISQLQDDGLVGSVDKPQYRGWVWRGAPKDQTFIDVSDLQKAKGDFYTAYLNKAKELGLTPTK